MHRFHRILVAILVLAACAGCRREEEHKPTIARVGEAVLMPGDLVAVRDSLWHSPGALREYVTSWVSSELLYQEAVRRGLAENEQMERRIRLLRRQLAVQALLDEVLVTTDTAVISDDAVAALYASGGSAFLLREDVANLSFALFADRDAANTFRSRILRGAAWLEAVAAAQQDTLTRTQMLQVATRQYFTRTNLYPEELWKLARTLPRDEISFVVKTAAGYYVIAVHSFRQQGEMPELEYCRNEIRDRLLIEQRRQSFERLLTALRGKTPVEVHMELLDSTVSGIGAEGD